MFRFLKDEDEEEKKAGTASSVGLSPVGPSASTFATSHHFNLREAEENLVHKDKHWAIANAIPHSFLWVKNVKLEYLLVSQLLTSSFVKADSSISKILDSVSDLITGVYEGGFKVWECTFDLINYLQDHFEESMNSKIVLDLGCGSGLLGLYALQAGAYVHFQDYNNEVINYLTIPNVLLNLKNKEEGKHEELERCRYFSGDWECIRQLFSSYGRKYDYILSSETIYNVGNLPKLLGLIKTALKPTGTMFLAAKTVYFGVGGGTTAFQELVEADGNLKCQVALSLREGVQREILSLKFKTQN